jgi:hypothetical protein
MVGHFIPSMTIYTWYDILYLVWHFIPGMTFYTLVHMTFYTLVWNFLPEYETALFTFLSGVKFQASMWTSERQKRCAYGKLWPEWPDFGKFSPIGQLFHSGQFLITEVSQISGLLCPRQNKLCIIFEKNVFGYFLQTNLVTLTLTFIVFTGFWDSIY